MSVQGAGGPWLLGLGVSAIVVASYFARAVRSAFSLLGHGLMFASTQRDVEELVYMRAESARQEKREVFRVSRDEWDALHRLEPSFGYVPADVRKILNDNDPRRAGERAAANGPPS